MSESSDPTLRLESQDLPPAATTPTPGEPAPRRPVRMTTVVWGVILLGLAALFIVTRVLAPDTVDLWQALAWGGLGLGVILIAGGIAAAARRD